jgi:hypothetical protein
MNGFLMSFLETLAEQSSLSRRQMQALISYLRVEAGEIKLKDAAALASQGRKKGVNGRPLTVGSYYRTLTQARANVEKSLVTVLIAMLLGVTKLEDVRRLFELVGGGGRELSDEESQRFMQLLSTLLKRMII